MIVAACAVLYRYFRRIGGWMTREDLAAHRTEFVEPLSTNYRGVDVYGLPPNSQGLSTLQILSILENFDLKTMGRGSADFWHVMVEAKKLAYADLARFVGDADHLDMPADQMLSDEFIAERRSRMNPTRAQERVDPGPLRTKSETIYLSVADAEGNMVSFINSIFDYFGSGIVVPGTGFALHNRGAGFTLTPGLPNTVAPGKRPFHTLIPAFVTQTVNGRGREQAYMSFGLMGGGVQAQGHVQFLLNHFVFGMDVQTAIDAPRFRHYDGLPVALEGALGVLSIQNPKGQDIPWDRAKLARFMPSLANDLGATMDAQRVRGHEWDKGKGGPIAKLRRTVPLVVPLTMNAIVNAEDTIDAMDLRGFGVGKRTWYRQLRFGWLDWLLVIAFAAFSITALTLGLTGNSQHYLLPFLVGS